MTAAPDISKGASTESGLDLNKAEERPDKDRKGSPVTLLLIAKTPKHQVLEDVTAAREVEDQGADPKLQSLQPQTGLPVSSIRSMGRENIKPLPGSQDSGMLPPTQAPLLRVLADV